jgi:phage baseplate assembly protein W
MATPQSTSIFGVITDNEIRNPIRSKKISTTGLKFPISNSPGRGYFVKATNIPLVKGNIRQLIHTSKGERVMLPNFGISLKRYLFKPLDEITFKAIQQDILTAFAEYLPNVKVVRLFIRNLEDISLTGESALLIKMIVKIREEEGTLFEVQTRVG